MTCILCLCSHNSISYSSAAGIFPYCFLFLRYFYYPMTHYASNFRVIFISFLSLVTNSHLCKATAYTKKPGQLKKCLETFRHEAALINSWGEVGGKLLKFSGCNGSNSHTQRRPLPWWFHCQERTMPPTDPFCELLWYVLFWCTWSLQVFSVTLYCAQLLVYLLGYQNILLSWLQHTISNHSKLISTWLPK